MVNAQQWLTDEYELPDYNGVTEKSRTLSISHLGNTSGQWLEGSLEIRDFPRVQTINLSWNSITNLKIIDCPELQVINLISNDLTSLSVDMYSSKNLKELDLSGNNFRKITDISLDTNFELERVDLTDNNFQAQNLAEVERYFCCF